MSENKPAPTIFIRENTRLPASVTLESETFLPGWRSIKNLDGRQLGRKIESAMWNYFYLAGPLKATVLGRESLATLRKAVQRVLAKKQSQNYTCDDNPVQGATRNSLFRRIRRQGLKVG